MNLIPFDLQEEIAQLILEKSKNTKPLMLEKFLKQHKRIILKARRNGHSYEDINAVLAEYNIQMTAAVLEACLTGAKKDKDSTTESRDENTVGEIVIDPSVKSALSEALKKLAETRKGVTKKEFIAAKKNCIAEALKQGWGFDDIAQWISDKGVKIAERTLRQYYREAVTSDGETKRREDGGNFSQSPLPGMQAKDVVKPKKKGGQKSHDNPSAYQNGKRFSEIENYDALEEAFNL